MLVFLFMREPEAGAVEAIPMRSGYVIATLVVSGLLVLQMGVSPSGYIDLAAAAAKLFA